MSIENSDDAIYNTVITITYFIQSMEKGGACE